MRRNSYFFPLKIQIVIQFFNYFEYQNVYTLLQICNIKSAILTLFFLSLWSSVSLYHSPVHKAYVGCSLGLRMIGTVIVLFGGCNAVASICWGQLVSVVGRRVLFCTAALMTIVAIVLMAVWTYQHPNRELLYFIAALWGIADAVWQPQIKGMVIVTRCYLYNIYILVIWI